MLHFLHTELCPCCIRFMFCHFQCTLFSCCTLSMLHSSHVAIFPCYTLFIFRCFLLSPFFFVLYFFHVALLSCCTLFLMHFFYIAFFSCYTLLLFVRTALLYFMVLFRVALFSCCTFLVLHSSSCCTVISKFFLNKFSREYVRVIASFSCAV